MADPISHIDQLELYDASGKRVAYVGMIQTWYIKNAYTPELRAAFAACVEHYFKLSQAHLHFGYYAYSDDIIHKLYPQKKPLPSISELIQQIEDVGNFSIEMTGAKNWDTASPYFLGGLSLGRNTYDDLSSLSIGWPVGFLEQQPPQFFQHWVDHWNQRLRPYHGYGGLGFIRCIDAMEYRKVDPVIFPMINRFPGLEVDNSNSHSLYCMDGIKNINWLNPISDAFIETLGGLSSVQQRLGEGFDYYPYPGGVMIQAGPVPQLGDAYQQQIPHYYQRLYRVVKPIQSKALKAFIYTPDGIDKKEFFKQWQTRFE